LIPASCSTPPSRCNSEVRDCTIFVRYAEARIMPGSRARCRPRVVAAVETSA
jgi:hypothetical protein